MDDLLEIYKKTESFDQRLEEMNQDFIQRLRCFLWGAALTAPTATPADPTVEASASNAVVVKAKMTKQLLTLPSPSPIQTKKRIKRLSSLNEDDEEANITTNTRSSNSKLLEAAIAMNIEEEEEELEEEAEKTRPLPLKTETEKAAELAPLPKLMIKADDENKCLMPPPASLPAAPPAVLERSKVGGDGSEVSEHSFARPKRAAKSKCEKNLKEAKLNTKVRRPSNSDKTMIKLEHEQRPSQMHEVSVSKSVLSSSAVSSSARSEDSVVVVPGKAPSLVEVQSEEEEEPLPAQSTHDNSEKKPDKENKKALNNSNGETRSLRIKIKREKVSLNSEEQRQPQEAAPDSATIADVATTTVPMSSKTPSENMTSDQSTLANTIVSFNTTKKGRKKMDVKPIKVERFSDINEPSPVSSRTRNVGRGQKSQEGPTAESLTTATTAAIARAASIYEDAVENLPTNSETPPTRLSQVPKAVAALINETVTIAVADKQQDATMVLGVAPNDATFCTAANMTIANPNATVTLSQKSGGNECDSTFNVPPPTNKQLQQQKAVTRSLSSTRHSMETAKDTSSPHEDSLITEDESFDRPLAAIKISNLPIPKAPSVIGKVSAISKLTGSAKAYKMPMPARTNELFNPLVQSPVKKKVQAFENAAAHAATEEQLTKTGRPKRTKENAAPTPVQASLTTPLIGKLQLPTTLGRFLTPTQASNMPSTMTAKKGPNSASKAIGLTKSISSSNIGASKPLSRENSVADDFRKGLHQMAEERKKQREQKHLLAAQQREAKERERAERIAKLAKERDEKRLKKQQEADLKKREMEEINRKIRQQEEAEAAAKQKAAAAYKVKAAAIQDQENELLAQMKTSTKGSVSTKASSRMMPPPQKILNSKYTFEMLHEDDSTDDEEKTSYKRPPPPTWSRSHVRGPAICMQQYAPTNVIDSFFSVQPMTPDLKLIFPNIDPRHLKRNSSVLWSTPPRYSELPKY